jgi:hypothetical protein
LCLRLQVKPTQFGPIDRASPYFRTIKTKRCIMSRNKIFVTHGSMSPVRITGQIETMLTREWVKYDTAVSFQDLPINRSL